MLILFDIDATLIKTAGAGKYAIADAARQLFGDQATTEGVEFGGSLDPLIMMQIMERCGIPFSKSELRRFRDQYRRNLEERLAVPGIGRSLPGAFDLVTEIHRDPDKVTGLLTGNFAETGTSKLRASGIDPDFFEIKVWGDDSPHHPPARHHLPPVAMTRFADRYGRIIPAEQVLIIGDTPNDVYCAKANHCRVLGVGTGQFSPAQLLECGADHAVPDLSATGVILDWINSLRTLS